MIDHPSSSKGPFPKYEWLDHTADIGIRVQGADPTALFINAGRAMFDLISDSCAVQNTTAAPVKVNVTGSDWVDLLVNWLRELLYFWTGREQLISQLDVDSISKNKIVGQVKTCPYAPGRHLVRHELKAVTYHQAAVKQVSGVWVAEIIFDV